MKLNESISDIVTKIFLGIIGILGALSVICVGKGDILNGVIWGLLVAIVMELGKDLDKILYKS
ncbi:TPA: hypothetical protein VBM32_002200 [Streptococcus agalactiae]|nr:hypothetical protein [Streptococcus agalactiae]